MKSQILVIAAIASMIGVACLSSCSHSGNLKAKEYDVAKDSTLRMVVYKAHAIGTSNTQLLITMEPRFMQRTAYTPNDTVHVDLKTMKIVNPSIYSFPFVITSIAGYMK